MATVASRRTSAWRRAWPVTRFVGGLVLGGLALYVVLGKRDELSGAGAALGHLRTSWLALACAAEVVSFLCFAALQRRLLHSGGLEVGFGALTAITFAGNAVANSLPGGPAWGSLYAYRQYRHRGADETLAAWTLVAVGVCSGVAMGVVATTGVAIAGEQSADLNLVGVAVGTLAIGAGLVVLVRRRRVVLALLTWAVRVSQRVARWPPGDAREVVEREWRRITAVSPARADWGLAIGWAALNWLWDAFCLATCFLAVSAGVPWRGLLLAYGAAQLAANLPITPGGLGVVEGSLTIALVAYGGAHGSTVAAVLLYRILNFWVPLPVGWATWGALMVRARSAAGPDGGEHVQEAVPV
ncbi:MAG TPA: YbhN family protein [Acidimicrobiales bacterium]|nr:YbhN family protein [Acidimicrobiales bacterium]